MVPLKQSKFFELLRMSPALSGSGKNFLNVCVSSLLFNSNEEKTELIWDYSFIITIMNDKHDSEQFILFFWVSVFSLDQDGIESRAPEALSYKFYFIAHLDFLI